jgi:hypothetical protein
MNTESILKYGHETVMSTLNGLPQAAWETPGVCGIWSVKEIIAHLASFEHMLADVLRSLLGEKATPTLDKFLMDAQLFNDTEVAARRDMSADEVLAEYNEAQARAADLLTQIPYESRRLNDALPWYGDEFDLEDFIAYTFYGHKREHSAQIAAFRDGLAAGEVTVNQELAQRLV